MPTLSYGPSRQHVLDLELPAGPGPHPVAFVIHGGFWRARYKRKLMRAVCADLVARGWASANVEYRRVGYVMGGGGGALATTADVALALDHLAVVDAPLDLDRVVTVGHSAGGHLALWLAAPREGARVRPAGAVGQAAVSDLGRGARLNLGAGIVRRFCGGPPDKVPEVYARVSPTALLPFGVPQLLVHGEADDIVPADLSRGHAEAARAAGDADVTLDLRPGEGHFEHIDASSGAWGAVTTWLTRFER